MIILIKSMIMIYLTLQKNERSQVHQENNSA